MSCVSDPGWRRGDWPAALPQSGTRFDVSHVRDLPSSSSIVVPIGGDEPVGLIAAHSCTGREWGVSDPVFLEASANIIAAARERQLAEDAALHLALHDTLTTLPNRALLHRRLDEALAGRHRCEHVALLLMDLDRFKEVNDALGHDIGDAPAAPRRQPRTAEEPFDRHPELR